MEMPNIEGDRKQGKAAAFPDDDAGLPPGKGEGEGRRVRYKELQTASAALRKFQPGLGEPE